MEKLNADKLIVPIYINEKMVLDMLAIIEDGFSMVSKVDYSEHIDENTTKGAKAGIDTLTPLLSKLLRIDISGALEHYKDEESQKKVSQERVHTNASLLSKLRSYLYEQDLLKTNISISDIRIGDFIEVTGELQKNPLIECLDTFIEILELAEIFEEPSLVGNRTNEKKQKQENQRIKKQIEDFEKKLKNSKTIDFIVKDNDCTAVLSTQEQYLQNDNNSELIGGSFKVLGKVIAICKEEKDNINLLRKTALGQLSHDDLDEIIRGFKDNEIKPFNLPELITKIEAPAVILIPIAIYI